MRNFTWRGLAIAISFLVLVLASSCAPRIGWGLLLWTDQEAGLHAGAIVPVYVRSNIEKKYIFGIPESKRKDEVPIWQIELFRSKRAAEKARAAFGSYLTSYLFANRDGLPVRDAPTNVGRRVYRLRQGQSVKILAAVQGDVVTTGTETLQGTWFKVLAEDGTQGYVFSNTMRLYDELSESPPSIAQSTAEDTARSVDLVFSRTWRGEYFQTMIDDGRIDLDTFNARFGLFADALRRQIRIELPMTSQVFNYASIAQSGQDFIFEGTPLRIRFDGSNRLIADWSGTTTIDQGNAASPQPQGPSPQPLSSAPASSTPGALSGPGAAAASAAAAPGAGAVGAPPGAPTGAPTATAPIAVAPVAGAPTAVAPAPGAPSSGLGQASASGANSATGPTTASTPGASSLPATASSSASMGGLSPGAANATQAVFVVLTQDIREVIRAEENRRLNALGNFVNAGGAWVFRPEASMASSGSPPSAESRLSIFRAGRFSWTSIDTVPAEYLGTDLGNVVDGTATGEATVRLYLDPTLGGSWEGALSLRFDGTRGWLDFLYRHDSGRLVLQPVASGGVKDLSVMTAGNLAPLTFDGSK